MKLKLATAILVFLATTAFSCDNVVKPDPKLPTDTDQCAPACENLRSLGCEEGEDLVNGETDEVVTCEAFCKETQEKGHALNPTCVAKITACDQIETECMEK